MRILNVTETYAPFLEFGGPPVKVRALAQGLARRGHAVNVLTADWGLEKRLHLRDRSLGLLGLRGHELLDVRARDEDVGLAAGHGFEVHEAKILQTRAAVALHRGIPA